MSRPHVLPVGGRRYLGANNVAHVAGSGSPIETPLASISGPSAKQELGAAPTRLLSAASMPVVGRSAARRRRKRLAS